MICLYIIFCVKRIIVYIFYINLFFIFYIIYGILIEYLFCVRFGLGVRDVVWNIGFSLVEDFYGFIFGSVRGFYFFFLRF